MRNKLTIIITLLVSVSCSGLLEIEPEGNLSGQILNDEESIQKALVGAYYNLSGINDGAAGGELLGGDFIVIPALLAHVKGTELTWDIVNAPAYDIFAQSEAITPLNDRVAANWIRAYETINAANTILANVSKIADNSERRRIEGEALAMRGLLYFEMCRLYGPQYETATLDVKVMPLLIEPALSVQDIGRPEFASVESIYTQAKSDLISASNLLEGYGKNGSGLSYYACQAYLTRLYMHEGDYESAVTAANNILDGGPYSLTPTPIEAFHNTFNSSEDIYATQQTLSVNAGDRTSGSGITAFYSSLSESGLGVLGVFQSVLFENSLFPNFGNYAEDDLRITVDTLVNAKTKPSEINSFYYQNQNNNLPELFSPAKYISAAHVIPIIRLAEIYLNRAESIFETDFDVIDPVALSDLNAVRTRSGLPALQASEFNDPIAFYDSIVVEKKREFFYEGLLFHDLKRRRSQLDDPSIIIGSLINPRNPLSEDFILPTPQAEVDSRD